MGISVCSLDPERLRNIRAEALDSFEGNEWSARKPELKTEH